MAKERQEWRPIDGFPTYEVSNLGRVRRWYDMTERYAELRQRMPDFTPEWGDVFSINLKPSRDQTVRLERERDSRKRVTRSIARLVLAAFVREPAAGEVPVHLDGNPRNNAVANLRWQAA